MKKLQRGDYKSKIDLNHPSSKSEGQNFHIE